LDFRWGSPDRLKGIKVYFDFNWRLTFGHDIGAFPNGMALAQLAVKECTPGRRPALLLTLRNDIELASFDWGDYCILVVNLTSYQRHATANRAIGFAATRLKSRISRIADVEASEGQITAFATKYPERFAEIADNLLGYRPGTQAEPATIGQLVELVDKVERLEQPEVDAVLRLLERRGVSPDYVLFRLLQSNQLDDISQALEWMLENGPDVVSQLRRLECSNLERLNFFGIFTMLQNLLDVWKVERDNHDEKFWQQQLERHSFVLAQLFAYPVIVLQREAYVGGKNVSGRLGNFNDFLLKALSTNNVAFVELKTPGTPLLTDQPYRGDVYNVGRELSGAVGQVLNQRQRFLTDFASLRNNSRGLEFEAFNPKCFVVAGNSAELSDDERKARSFELNRNNWKDVQVVTFDELFGRVEAFMGLLNSDRVPATNDAEPSIHATDGRKSL